MTDGSVVVTGGAGFIGSYLVRALLERGVEVRVLDNLEPQVHSCQESFPSEGCHFLRGDITDPEDVARSLEGATSVVHFAALVGVGQSMYEIVRYVRTNCLGTAILLEQIAKRRTSIRRLIVASSMSIYGEGAYVCPACKVPRDGVRAEVALKAGRWEPTCPACGQDLRPVPTPEDHPLKPASVYAITKRDQEELFLAFGRAYGIPTVALRFFNVYGPGQALSNPYTGVVAIFAARMLAGLPPLVFEDGGQTRDFVHVHDVAAACIAALEHPDIGGTAINVGTGEATRILEVARLLHGIIDGPEPVCTGQYRPGDVRHCVANVASAERLLGWRPKVRLNDGLHEMAGWLKEQRPPKELLDRPFAELKRAGLLR